MQQRTRINAKAMTALHREKVADFATRWLAGQASERGGIAMGLAVYFNAHNLGNDKICPSCPAADELMQEAITAYVVAAPMAAKTKNKKSKGIEPDAIIE